MTQVADRPIEGTPLTNPVPGTWLQPSFDAPAVYVPHEREAKKIVTHFADGSEESREEVRYIQGAHYKRLILEGWAIVSGPQDVTTPRPDVDALQTLIEQQARELAELRAKIEGDRDAATTNAGRKR